MTTAEAWKIIEECRNWNYGQRSVQAAFGGARTVEDDILDARRAALKEAWRTVGAEPPAGREDGGGGGGSRGK